MKNIIFHIILYSFLLALAKSESNYLAGRFYSVSIKDKN